MHQHIENKLSFLRTIFEEVANRIEALKLGERMPATLLAQTIAAKYEMTGTTLYPTLLIFLKGYPNIKLHRGRNGGIERLPTKEPNDKENS
jgi:hypothetical protein